MTKPDAQKLEGAISGRALYDGRIDPAEALTLLRAAQVRHDDFGDRDETIRLILAPRAMVASNNGSEVAVSARVRKRVI